ncbi:MAG TPA: hypothetical protein ENJ95_08715 [Bacteroidetes bacterium]|nr:hypothetical protein [Bacteroidota bacterium]
MTKEKKSICPEPTPLMKELGARFMTKEEEKELEKFKDKSYQTKKYRKGLKFLTLLDMQEKREKHPDWPLNKIVAASIEGINPEIPPELLLEVIAHLIKHWEEKTMEEAVAA